MRKILIFLIAIFVCNASYSEESRIHHFPNSSESQITFIHAGDVYVVPIAGGLARRITSSEGLEMTPRFSPDGKTIAFSAEYDGNREIYTMPSEGGTAKRITYSMDIQGLPERMGPDKIIMQWTKDANSILYRSRHESWQAWTGKLFTVNKNGGLPKMVQVPVAGFATFSPDESKIAYNRVFREFRTWKRYRGGQADDIWIYDLKSKELKNITNNPAQDIIPMWVGDKVYYLSDRDKVMNLFVYNLKTGENKKVTNFTDYDVKYPSMGAKHIAFDCGGFVYLVDYATDSVKKVSIEISEDFPQLRSSLQNVKDKIQTFDLSNDGKRAVFSARGDVFTVPTGKGFTKNYTKSSNSHERNVTYSPDGKWIAYISDKSGEDEIYLQSSNDDKVIQLTNNSISYRYELLWSPDSKKILTSDKSLRLYWIDIETKKVNEIVKSKAWEIRDFSWSPDNKWIAYTDKLESGFSVVNLYNLETKRISQATSEFFNSNGAIFSPGGKYLFFVSNRSFNASVGEFEWNFQYNNMSKIYGICLAKNTPSLFAFQDDEEQENDNKQDLKKEDKKSDDKKKDQKKDDLKDDKKDEKVEVKIDLDGIEGRIFEFPIDAGNYNSLYASKKHLLYYNKGNGKLYYYDAKERKEVEAGDFSSYVVSSDEKKVLIQKDGNYYISNFGEKISLGDKINLDDLKVKVNKQEEWKQIYNEAWRQMRDFFYDPNMHGVDWKAIKDKYAVYLPYVEHRADLTFIIGEMIGELSIGHAYFGGGEMPNVAKVPIGLLGCEFEQNEKNGSYKISKIFEGRNWDEKTRSPLTEPNFEIKEGDYLLAIDDIELTNEITPYMALEAKANKYVKLLISSTGQKSDAKEYKVKTISSETGLRYFNWVESNRKYVEAKSGGKVGYVHIPDMGLGNGLNEFAKYYYPQVRKEALIIDDRYNGGGNVSSMIIERLRREIGMLRAIRNLDYITTTPDVVHTGPLVGMINELSASDGDLFPYQFKLNKLGKLIGKRTWGGVVGIRGSLPFLDGSYLNKPEFAHYSHEGKWILEGVGMLPDIEVDNMPDKVLEGIDQQLDKAIETALEEIKTNNKRQIVPKPEYPKKN